MLVLSVLGFCFPRSDLAMPVYLLFVGLDLRRARSVFRPGDPSDGDVIWEGLPEVYYVGQTCCLDLDSALHWW